MAIIYAQTGAISWEGRVLEIKTQHNVKIMSDVWVDQTVAVVWDEGYTRTIILSDTEWGESRRAFVDATPDVLAEYRAWVAKEDARKAQEKAAEEAKELSRKQDVARLSAEDFFDRGDRVRVVALRGRGAPPLGTEGEVTWTGTSETFGTKRVGFKDSLGEVHYTARSNVKRVFDNPPTDGDWVSFLAALKEAKAQTIAAAPKKGAEVFLKDDPSKRGKVFWVSPDGTRVGFKPSSKAEPFWASPSEIVQVGKTPAPEKVEPAPVAETPAVEKVAPAPVAETKPNPHEVPQSYEVSHSRVADYPAPLCDIARIIREGDVWGAYSSGGEFIMCLPEATVRALV